MNADRTDTLSHLGPANDAALGNCNTRMSQTVAKHPYWCGMRRSSDNQRSLNLCEAEILWLSNYLNSKRCHPTSFIKLVVKITNRSNISINEIFCCVRRSWLQIKSIRICSNVGTVVIWKWVGAWSLSCFAVLKWRQVGSNGILWPQLFATYSEYNFKWDKALSRICCLFLVDEYCTVVVQK